MPERLAELSRLPEGEQIRRVSLGGRFADPGLAETLIERCHAARYQSAKKMLHLGHLAYLAAEACTATAAGDPARLADLQAHAHGAYGNAQRVCGHLLEADETLTAAFERWETGSKSPWLWAFLLCQVGSLRTHQRRFSEAIQLAEEAGKIFQELGETQILACTMIQTGVSLVYSGDSERAVEIFRQAIPIIDREEDPRLFLAAHHNLARCYIDLGRPDEAISLFVESRPLYQQCKEPLVLLKAPGRRASS